MAGAGIFISQIKIFKNDTSNLAPSLPLQDDNGNSSLSVPNNNVNEYTEVNYPSVLDFELTSLTTTQRNIFTVLLAILFVLSMCGNLCTLYVNCRRKIRPFFRACLISLAVSDLINTVFLATAYLSQFMADYVQLWSLGEVMCGLVPFATTCAILASSLTLVGIALDRYFAVMKAVIDFWNPSVISCIACTMSIWLASITIAYPVYTFYNLISVYILTEDHETTNNVSSGVPPPAITLAEQAATARTSLLTTNYGFMGQTSKKPIIKMTENFTSSTAAGKTTIASVKATAPPWQSLLKREGLPEHDLSFILERRKKLVNMCTSNQENASVYYGIVFAIIFVPCVVAFFWFNSIIARKLWKRRHFGATAKERRIQKTNEKTKSQTLNSGEVTKMDGSKISNCGTTAASSSQPNTLPGKVVTPTTNSRPTAPTNNCREARHLRMFTFILLMMVVFVFLRLPAWIFLLMRLYGNYSQLYCWILYFVFGLMNLASSVLNPLFYTFFTETIQYAVKIKAQVSSVVCGCSSHCDWRKNRTLTNTFSAIANNTLQNKVARSCDLQRENIEESGSKTLSFFKNCCNCFSGYQTELKPENEHQFKNTDQAKNNDRDEGVEYNDEIDKENVCDLDDQTVYTIFPPSLVSSSLSLQNS